MYPSRGPGFIQLQIIFLFPNFLAIDLVKFIIPALDIEYKSPANSPPFWPAIEPIFIILDIFFGVVDILIKFLIKSNGYIRLFLNKFSISFKSKSSIVLLENIPIQLIKICALPTFLFILYKTDLIFFQNLGYF